MFALLVGAALAGEVSAVTLGVAVGIAGFADALVQGANFSNALTSGFFQGVTAGAFSAIASSDLSFIGGRRLLTQSLSFGVVGGVTSALQGGKFGNGFLSAGLGTPLGFGVHSAVRGVAGDLASRIVTPLVVGGTLSELTGGKFANGAACAAFSIAVEGVVAAYYRPEGFVDNSPVAVPEDFEEGKVPAEARKMILEANPNLEGALDRAYIRRMPEEFFQNEGPRVPAKTTGGVTIYLREGRTLSLYGLSHEIQHVQQALTIGNFPEVYRSEKVNLRHVYPKADERLLYYRNRFEREAEATARAVMKHHDICMRPVC